MPVRTWTLVLGISLLAISSANGQVVRGSMVVTGAEMH